MSFGMLADGGILVPIGLTSLAVAVSAWLFWMAPGFSRTQRLAAPLIAGGAIGNAIDRLRFGKVVDFIDVHYAGWHWPAFNLADAAKYSRPRRPFPAQRYHVADALIHNPRRHDPARYEQSRYPARW